MSDTTTTYTLKRPIAKVNDRAPMKVGEVSPLAPAVEPDMLTEVKVRRPTAGDLRVTDAHKGEMGKAIALLAHLASLSPRTIERLDVEDFEALSDIIGNFSAAGRAA